MHALTHDVNTYPKPCLYCQLDSSSEYGTADSSEDDFSECFFVPCSGDENNLLRLFEAFSEAAERNPDPNEEDDDDFFVTGDDDLIFDADEARLGAEQTRRLEHLESVFVAPSLSNHGDVSGQFEDMEEDSSLKHE